MLLASIEKEGLFEEATSKLLSHDNSRDRSSVECLAETHTI
jgi:hypothetical protein